jgi:hypothetical protein
MHRNDARWKAAYDPGPDPMTYKAMLSEFQMGHKRSMDEPRGQVAPESSAMNLETSDVVEGAEEAIDLLKQVVRHAQQSNGVRINPQRFVAKLSAGLSKMLYNLGRVQGYRDSAR